MNLKVVLVLILSFHFALAAYDAGILRKLAYYSHFAYQPESAVTSWVCDYCGDFPLNDRLIYKNDKENLFGYMGYAPNLGIVIALRGTTKNKNNVLADLNFNQVDYPKCNSCKVHKGFYNSIQLLRDQIIHNLRALTKKYPNSQLYITGHSLGGAMAALLAADLKQTTKFTVTAVYTYGKPRVGNKAFAAWYNTQISTSIRAVNNQDIVASNPPKSLVDITSKAIDKLKNSFHFHSLNQISRHDLAQLAHHNVFDTEYWHEGSRQIWFVSDKKTIFDCTTENPKCFDSVPATKLSPTDHLLENYMKTVDAATVTQKWKTQVIN